MAVVKYVPDHKEPQNTIRYIAKAGKTKNGEKSEQRFTACQKIRL